MRRPQPHPQMGAPRRRICCSSRQQLPDSPHCCMSGFSEGHTMAPLATLVVASCHNTLPLHWPVQGKKRPRSKHMQPPQQTHRVPTIATHMKVSSQKLIFYQQGGPQVPAQLVDQHTSKVWLHSTNPFRTTSAACPSKSVAGWTRRRFVLESAAVRVGREAGTRIPAASRTEAWTTVLTGTKMAAG